MEVKTIKNRTWKYLVPLFNTFDKQFRQNFGKLRIVKYGIHDTLLDGSEVSDEMNIYCLCDRTVNYEHYKNVRDWFTHHEQFVAEYNPTDKLKTPYTMLVFKLPFTCKNAYDNFLAGKYSKMYSKQQIDKLFLKRSEEVKGVLLRDQKGLEYSKKILKQEFDINEETSWYLKQEYDIPPKMREEVFNVIDSKPIFFNKSPKQI